MGLIITVFIFCFSKTSMPKNKMRENIIFIFYAISKQLYSDDHAPQISIRTEGLFITAWDPSVSLVAVAILIKPFTQG